MINVCVISKRERLFYKNVSLLIYYIIDEICMHSFLLVCLFLVFKIKVIFIFARPKCKAYAVPWHFHGQTIPSLMQSFVKYYFKITSWSFNCGKLFQCVFVLANGIVQLQYIEMLFCIIEKGLFLHRSCRVAQLHYCTCN